MTCLPQSHPQVDSEELGLVVMHITENVSPGLILK